MSLLAGYWSQKVQKLLKKNNGLCLVCDQAILPYQETDVHHIKPKKLGGTDKHKNLLVLHKTCHTQVTHVKDPEVIARFVTKGILDLKRFSE